VKICLVVAPSGSEGKNGIGFLLAAMLLQYDAIDRRTAVTIMGAWWEVVPEPHSISDFLALFRALHRLADSRV
jgi:hypothetical protein